MAKKNIKEDLNIIQNDIGKWIKQTKANISDIVTEKAREAFNDAEVITEAFGNKLHLIVQSQDKDFLKKEFGADNYPPARRALKFKRAMDVTMKRISKPR